MGGQERDRRRERGSEREGERRRKIGLFVSDLRIWHEKSERRPSDPAQREGQGRSEGA